MAIKIIVERDGTELDSVTLNNRQVKVLMHIFPGATGFTKWLKRELRDKIDIAKREMLQNAAQLDIQDADIVIDRLTADPRYKDAKKRLGR